MNALRIGVCGNGTVGGGTIELLRNQAGLLAARGGCELRLSRVGARRLRDDCDTGDVPVHEDLMEVARASDVDVLVECIGGTTTALDLVRAAIDNGKSVVTANKALIAEHGNELLELAEAKGVSLLCEAAVAGGIPILKALREGMAANNVESLAGIINGTGNYILTEMELGQRRFEDVLAEAQALGYAEADPSFDIDGIDAAHKLSILAAMAFAMRLNFAAVHCEGISDVTPEDISFAREMGYRIKHLGVARQTAAGVELRVHPALLPADSLLGNVDGVLNAVRLDGHAAGPTLYTGAGAGRLATASAVVADLVDLARAGGRPVQCLGCRVSQLSTPDVLPMLEVRTAWYLRLRAKDRPGVMAQLTGCLGAEDISAEAIIQKPPVPGSDMVTVVALTNPVQQSTLQRAITAIKELPAVLDAPYGIRVEASS